MFYLQKTIKYFYKRPRALFNTVFIASLFLHGIILADIPFLRLTGLPAKKADITAINVTLQNLSRTNSLIKKETVAPFLKEKDKKAVKKEKIAQKELISSPPSVSRDLIIKATENYYDKILKRINAMKHYPALARRKAEEGVVKVKFSLTKDGALKDEVSIVKKCRHRVLNEAAVETILRGNPYPAFPDKIKKDEMSFVVEVDFRLEVW